MIKNYKLNKSNESILYNKILLLSRNKIFYTKYKLSDTFQNRIYLMFLHLSFLFIKIKNDKIYKKFYQNMFDYLFNQIELNMREIGFGDVTINKNMKFLVKKFYSILLNCEKYNNKNKESKKLLLFKILSLRDASINANKADLTDYFDKYEAFCFDLSSDSILKGELNFNY